MLDDYLLQLLTFAAVAAVLTVTPGVDTAMVLRSSALYGQGAGIAAGFGISAGLLVWGVGAALGLTALLDASPVAFAMLQWAGVIYLLCLGVRLMVKPGERECRGRKFGEVGRGAHTESGGLTVVR